MNHAAFLRTMEIFEASLTRRLIIQKNIFIRAAAERYEATKQPDLFDLADRHQQSIWALLANSYRRIIPAFGMLTLAQVKSRKNAEEQLLFARLAERWINTEGLKRSKLIADTTEADVLAAIAKGFDEGDGVAAIARRIRKVTALSPFRADLIARTETHAAANYASVESVRDAEQSLGIVMLKEWLPTLDSRTRDDHAAMAGSAPIPMNEKFIVGGEAMDRPGDPAASAGNVISCRCTLAYSEAG